MLDAFARPPERRAGPQPAHGPRLRRRRHPPAALRAAPRARSTSPTSTSPTSAAGWPLRAPRVTPARPSPGEPRPLGSSPRGPTSRGLLRGRPRRPAGDAERSSLAPRRPQAARGGRPCSTSRPSRPTTATPCTCATCSSSSCSTPPGCGWVSSSASTCTTSTRARRTVRVLGKGAKERIVPYGAPAQRALESWLTDGRPALRTVESGSALLLGARGRRIDPRTARSVVHRTVAPRARRSRHRAARTATLGGDTPARGRRGPPHRPRDIGARYARDNTDLHPCQRRTVEGYV